MSLEDSMPLASQLAIAEDAMTDHEQDVNAAAVTLAQWVSDHHAASQLTDRLDPEHLDELVTLFNLAWEELMDAQAKWRELVIATAAQAPGNGSPAAGNN
jgi:hypothetical protein